MGDFVSVEFGTAPRVATVRLDRPPMNAINAQVLEELEQAVEEVAADSETGAVVLWGGPQIFAAGADVKEFSGFGPVEAEALSLRLNATFAKLAGLSQISIAAVCGFALGGGCELAMCTDFRVMADDARFGQPEILLGIIPGAGGTQRLSRLVGLARAKELVYTGRQVKSAEAVAIGLASETLPAADVYDRSLAMAADFAAGPAALANAKSALDTGFDLPLAAALEIEAREFGASFGTSDAGVGIDSFLANGPGKADFTGS